MLTVLRDVVENAQGVVDSANVNFKTFKPYVPGTLSVYINGQLKVATAPDGWVEGNPALGTFTTTTAPETGDSVQVSYTDQDPRPLLHPLYPIPVENLKPGMVVRIQLRGGFVFEYANFGISEVKYKQNVTAYRHSAIIGTVINNDFQNRIIQVDYQDRIMHNEHYVVAVEYKKIRQMEKMLEGSLVSDSVHRLRIPAYVRVLGLD